MESRVTGGSVLASAGGGGLPFASAYISILTSEKPEADCIATLTQLAPMICCK